MARAIELAGGRRLRAVRFDDLDVAAKTSAVTRSPTREPELAGYLEGNLDPANPTLAAGKREVACACSPSRSRLPRAAMTQSSPLAQPEAWNFVADGYESSLALVEPFSAMALAQASPSPRARIVDVACGPGTLALQAAPRVAHVDALDFSTEMIARLQARAAAAGAKNIDARVGDGEALPYPERSFDAAFSMFGLMFFANRDRGFAELRRVLKPGAPAVVSGWLPFARVPVMQTMMATVARLLPSAVPPPGPGPLGDGEECPVASSRRPASTTSPCAK